MKKTKLTVCPKEWARIENKIYSAFDVAGLSRLYAERAKDLVASIIYDTKASRTTGRKRLGQRPCVSHPERWFAKIFRNRGLAWKCKKALVASGVLLPDGSWCAPADECEREFAHPGDTWCNSYAIDYNPQGAETLDIWFPSASSVIEGAVADLRRIPAELDYTADHSQTLRLDKAGLLAAARSGAVDAQDFATACALFRKYPTLDKCISLGEPDDHRTYTPPTMVSKTILPYIRGISELREVLDLHCSLLLSLMFVFVVEGAAYKDGVCTRWLGDGNFDGLVHDIYTDRWMTLPDGRRVKNPDKDIYWRVYRHILAEQPSTNLFKGLSAKEIRDRIKTEFMGAVYASPADAKRYRTLAKKAMAQATGKAPRASKREFAEQRKARIRLAIRDWLEATYPTLAHYIFTYATTTKVSIDKHGRRHTRQTKTPLYYAMTRGEQALMGYLADTIRRRYHVTVYRKHDALLCADPAYTPTPEAADNLIRDALSAIGNVGPSYRNLGCTKIRDLFCHCKE